MKTTPLVIVSTCVLLLLLFFPLASSAQSVQNWAPNTPYAVGALVMFNGVEYKCIQAHTSEVGWEPPNTPALWQPVTSGGGGGGGCSAAPSAPTGLSSSSTTSSGTMLNWSAAGVSSGCSVSSYTVFENGNSIGTTGGTSFNVTGLAASTTYSFTVSASDSFGTSGKSGAISVTTASSGGGGGGGGGCGPAWDPNTAYSAPGTLVTRNGINYTNNWWTQGEDPATHNGPAGSGQPWTSHGACSTCSTLPSVPTGLSASAVSSGSTTLRWNASTAASNCSITGYTVFENGNSIGTAGGTSFTVNGLCSATSFSFAVAANDSAGSSGRSSTVSVTGSSSCGGGGGGKVTFAAYKDVTLNADFNTGLQRSGVTGTVQPVTSAMPNQTLVWAFATGSCDSESWAGISPSMEATNVQAFVNAGKHYIISTGGANGSFDCSSGQGLINFINRYNSANLVGIDFDIELGQSQQLIDNLINATKVAEGQFPNLQFSFTIQSLGTTAANPITGGSAGTTVVNEIKRLGLGGNYVVNLMTFDYGSTNPNNCVVANGACDMGNSAIAAAQALNQQSGIPFNHIGVTMMIGRADTQDEVTSQHDIDTIDAFVLSNGLPLIRYWSFDRDTPGGGGSSSSGTNVPALAYTREFMNSLGVQ